MTSVEKTLLLSECMLFTKQSFEFLVNRLIDDYCWVCLCLQRDCEDIFEVLDIRYSICATVAHARTMYSMHSNTVWLTVDVRSYLIACGTAEPPSKIKTLFYPALLVACRFFPSPKYAVQQNLPKRSEYFSSPPPWSHADFSPAQITPTPNSVPPLAPSFPPQAPADVCSLHPRSLYDVSSLRLAPLSDVYSLPLDVISIGAFGIVSCPMCAFALSRAAACPHSRRGRCRAL